MKIKETEDKACDYSAYITTNLFDKISDAILDERLKRAKLVINKYLGTVDFDFNYFLGKVFFVITFFKIRWFTYLFG